MTLTFTSCLAFTWLPQNDGQPYHVDRGQGTAWAVTEAVWVAWSSNNAMWRALQDAPKSDLALLLCTQFWRPAGADLPSGVNLMVFDFGVTAGPERSAKFLQSVLGVRQDGIIGPATLAAAEKADQADLCKRLHARHAAYYGALPDAAEERGWFVRNNARLAAALWGLVK